MPSLSLRTLRFGLPASLAAPATVRVSSCSHLASGLACPLASGLGFSFAAELARTFARSLPGRIPRLTAAEWHLLGLLNVLRPASGHGTWGCGTAALQPVVDVLVVWVVVLELLLGVEAVDALAREARRGNPVPPVRARVVVEQQLLEVSCAIAPVDSQVEDEVAGDVLAPAIAHEACCLELAHVCIHKRVVCAPVFPTV
mmetsp:Transcript_81610/g.239602  ORF Transcript_81610/g.239602 Transcript_81610/m.239602 type:complete len:200 (-) Transcript_81610:1066-1665(-)